MEYIAKYISKEQLSDKKSVALYMKVYDKFPSEAYEAFGMRENIVKDYLMKYIEQD